MSNRRSVRTYDGKLISESDREKLQQLIDRADNPYNIPIEYRFLEPGKHDLKSPVLSGETLYLAGKMKRVPHFEEVIRLNRLSSEHVSWGSVLSGSAAR